MSVRGEYPVEVFNASKRELMPGDTLLARISGTRHLVGKPVGIVGKHRIDRNLSNLIAVRLTIEGKRRITPQTLFQMMRYEHHRGTFIHEAHGSLQQTIRLSDARRVLKKRGIRS